MQQHIQMLRCLCRIMDSNVQEAHKYAVKAHEMRHAQHKQTADWYAEMAKGHLSFNSQGSNMVEKLMAELKTMEPAYMSAEILTMFGECIADVKEDTAEVQAMLDAYHK